MNSILVKCSHDKMVCCDSLVEHPRNPNTHSDKQIKLLAKIIKHQGWRSPIVVSKRSGFVVSGHGRLMAANILGLESVPINEQDFESEAEEYAHLIADNRIAELAELDNEELRSIVAELEGEIDLDLTGFDNEALSELLGNIINDEIDAEPQIDKAEELREEWGTELGQLWQLGKHRLLCGDSTSKEDVERLMDGEKADMVFTDPPYNVDYEGYTKDKLTIKSDSMSEEGYAKFLHDVFSNYKSIVQENASLYICHASSWQQVIESILNEHEIEVRNQIIWGKNTFAWGFGRYKFQHEPIFYCHLKDNTDNWYGDKTQSTLWIEKKPSSNKSHPTMKPVEIMIRAINNSSIREDTIVDLFLGSGSTLIACEQTKRICYGMEIDPAYVAVILQRYQDATKDKPTLVD